MRHFLCLLLRHKTQVYSSGNKEMRLKCPLDLLRLCDHPKDSAPTCLLKSQICQSFSLGVADSYAHRCVPYLLEHNTVYSPGHGLWLWMMSSVQNGCFCIHVLYNRRKCSCCMSVFSGSLFYLLSLFSPPLLYHMRPLSVPHAG